MKKVRTLHLCVDDKFLGNFFIPNARGLGLIHDNDSFLIYSKLGDIRNRIDDDF